MTAAAPPSGPLPKVHTVEEAIERTYRAFWRKYEANAELREKLAGKSRVILVDILDAEPWTFHIEDGKLARYERGGHPAPDARLEADTRDFLAVFNRELSPVTAYLTGRIKVHAKLGDVLFVKSLLG